MKKRGLFSLYFWGLALATLLVPGLIYAQAPGENEHDGFFFRYQAGFGSGDAEGEFAEQSGTAGFSTLQLGGAVTPSFVIHGGFSYALISGDLEFSDGDSTTGDFVMLLPTVGVSFYIMPINIYISPELYFAGSATGSGDDYIAPDGTPVIVEDSDAESGQGFGVRIGKEWWVSPNWGLGIALHYSQVSFDFEDCDSQCGVDTSLFGIAFSATYN